MSAYLVARAFSSAISFLDKCVGRIKKVCLCFKATLLGTLFKDDDDNDANENVV